MSENNLFKPSDTLSKQKLELSTSLKDKLNRLKTSLKHTLLLDLSGSMHEPLPTGQSKRGALEDIVNKLPKELKKYAFSGNCERIEGNNFPMMGGSTRLAEAFDFIKEEGITEVILITDGEPDSPKRSLDSAKGLKIEIIYIGPMPRPQFLEDLAKGANGSFISIDMLKSGAAGELENKIKGLIGA